MNILRLSKLPKTWVLDLDGTIFPHNSYLNQEIEEPLEGVKEFFKKIAHEDFVIILTSRKEEYREQTERNLKKSELNYNILIMEIPTGERILINDSKPSGMPTAYSIRLTRDEGFKNFGFVESSEI